jgi:hypothetical protein
MAWHEGGRLESKAGLGRVMAEGTVNGQGRSEITRWARAAAHAPGRQHRRNARWVDVVSTGREADISQVGVVSTGRAWRWGRSD